MWLNPQLPADLVTFTEGILNKKLLLLCSETGSQIGLSIFTQGCISSKYQLFDLKCKSNDRFLYEI